MRPTRDLATLADAARAAPSLEAYERELLGLLERRVGFDVAFVRRGRLVGPHMPGFDPAVLARVGSRWPSYAADTVAVREAARRARDVAVDADVVGGALERLSYYQEIMRPHRGRSTALVFARWRGAIVATLAIGRCAPTFRERELEYLRAIAPTVALCEAALAAAAPATAIDAALTAREREILGYLHLGYSNAQIAAAVGSAPATVRNQLSSAYRKLGVANRAEAVGLVGARSR